MVAKRLSNDVRKRIIDSYNDGNSSKSISNFFGIPRTTIDSVIKIYNSTFRIFRGNSGGSKKKISDDVGCEIRSWIDQDCAISLKEIKARCMLTFNLNVSIATLHRYVQGFNYSFKRISLLPAQRNSDPNIEKRREYAEEFYHLLSTIDNNKFIFIDEVGFNISMRQNYGRSMIGTRAIKIVPGLRNKNFSVCCAISKETILDFKIQKMAYNTEYFTDFIYQLIEKLRSLNIENAVLVLDNVPFHKSASIKTLIELNGHKILFLPPYSPFLNPIENFFSQWKSLIRRQNIANEDQLLQLLPETISEISNANCRSYFSHMLSFLPACLRSESITEE